MDLNQRVQRYNEEHQKLLQELSLAPGVYLDFPGRKKIPFLSKIAILILKAQGFVASVKVSETNK